MSAVFVTATGTDIGKTYLTAALVRRLRQRSVAVEACKPVVTGFDPANAKASDPGVLLTALGYAVTRERIEQISPWRFAPPLAPALAARREGRALDFDALVEFSQKFCARPGVRLIEGIGGIMVPLDGEHTVLDWMATLQAPLLLVAGSYLGSISHTLTCLDVLRRRDLAVRAVVVNETPGSTVAIAETLDCLSRFADATPLIALRRQDEAVESATLDDIITLIQ